MHLGRFLRAVLGCAAALSACVQGALAVCGDPLSGFAVFQCADRAYFQPVPDPNFTPQLDPNNLVTNIYVVFWQLGFGNNNLNTGKGNLGTGMSGIGAGLLFNGNDKGILAVDLGEARLVTGDANIPAGALCLRNNNWGNTGIDGCCDNDRGTTLPWNNDDILNPYYEVPMTKNGYYGVYSLAWQQDYPIAVLLREPSGRYFAVAAVATTDRGNDGTGNDGWCCNDLADPNQDPNRRLWDCGYPSNTNPAPCDLNPGSYSLKAVSNGLPNPAVPGANNVIPWQEVPDPSVDSDVPVDPNNPNSDHILDLVWPAAVVHSDESVRPTAHPQMAPADPTRAAGVGVTDIGTKFPLIRYIVEVAPEADPNFASPTGSTERFTSSITGLTVPSGSCYRVRTLFGKKPETATASEANCRVGKCGDIGYEVASWRHCVGPGGCTPTGPEVCDDLDNDCDGTTDGFATACGLGACASTGFCTAGVDTCTPGTPAADDSVCNGIDDDCDGTKDEEYVSTPTTCGAGICAASGAIECLAGVTTDTCTPGTPAAEVCDDLDNDCDGTVDGFATVCGIGACASTGFCAAGADSCAPGAPAADDALCNNADDDCDGATDEEFVAAPTTCGVGPCAASGAIECLAGVPTDTCTPGTPAGDDSLCNNVDDDCDGATDEEFVPAPTACGVGACASTGVTQCVGGSPGDTCTPGTPAAEACDGVDNDCDGTVDGFATACGVGACAAAGTCAAGLDTCSPGPSSLERCDGADDDCDGQSDEGGVCGTVVIFDPVAGATLDCRQDAPRPTIRWDPGPYDRYKLYLSWVPDLSSRVTSGDTLLKTTSWTVNKRKWRRACRKAAPYLYIQVMGKDRDVPRSDPARKTFSEVVQAGTQK